ncbi:MAG: hypothetical protein JWL61_3379 [Gemmatimonadetes bacterium]|nr:hypothetical protein [Gemmatimonadota bacterium]
MMARASIATRLLFVAALLTASQAGAQDALALRAGVARVAEADSATSKSRPIEERSRVLSAVERLPLWSAPIASAILPGLGQVRLGKDRFMGYLAAEAFLVLQYAKNTREANDNTREYRAIARDIARRNFPGTHPDTVWQYYEKVGKFLESGVFSRSTSGPILPEIDAGTYNGEQWILARQAFGIPLDVSDDTRNPNYADALSLYESRAITAAYGWSWRNAQLERDVFTKSIGRSNDAYRRANNALVAIIANHLLSAVDAFASVRLISAAGGEVRVSASIPIR